MFSPDVLRTTSAPLLDWLDTIGATKVAIHFDVTTRSTLMRSSWAWEPTAVVSPVHRPAAWSPTSTVRPKLSPSPIAEFIPRQVMQLQQVLAGFPLLGPRA